MKRIISFLLLSYSCLGLSAQYAGQMDLTFGDQGKVIFQPPEGSSYLRSLKKSPDGKIYVCGSMELSGGSHGFVARYTYDGQPDGSFNAGNNYVAFQFDGLSTNFNDLVIRSDGKIIVVGTVSVDSYTQHIALARLLPDGTFDATFGNNGQIILSQFNARATVMTLLYNNAFAVAGSISNGSSNDLCLMGFLPGGNLNTNFGVNGCQVMDLNADSYDNPGSITFFNSRILISSVAGRFDYDAIVLNAFTELGQPDAGFGVGGKVVYDGLNLSPSVILYPVSRHAIDGSGRIWVASTFYGLAGFDGILLRFLSNGTPDNSFGDFGMKVYEFGDADTEFHDIGVQLDGKVVVVGSWASLGNDETLFARFTPDGELDPQVGSNNTGYIAFSMEAGGSIGDYATRLMFPWIDKVVVAGFCSLSSSFSWYMTRLYLNVTVGQPEPDPIAEFKLYNDNQSIVLTGNGVSEIKSMRIYDAQGKLLENFASGFEDPSSGVIRLALSQPLSRGFYVVELSHPSGNQRIKFIVH